MDWNALLIALIIFPIIWGFYAAGHTRSYGLIALSVLCIMSSIGGCTYYFKNEWTIPLPKSYWGFYLFFLGYFLCVVISTVAIVRDRRQRLDATQMKSNGDAEPTSAGDVANRAAPKK